MKARLPQGYGKQSMAQLMQQAQQMQENVKKKQEELEQTLYLSLIHISGFPASSARVLAITFPRSCS